MGLVTIYAIEDKEIKFREVNSHMQDKPTKQELYLTDAFSSTATSCYLCILIIGNFVMYHCIVRTLGDLDPRT